MIKRTVDARVNAFTCPKCDEGTLLVPATMRLVAKLEAKKVYVTRTVECTKGHEVNVRLEA